MDQESFCWIASMEPESAMQVSEEERTSAILHSCQPSELCDQSARQDGPRAPRCISGMTVVEGNNGFLFGFGARSPQEGIYASCYIAEAVETRVPGGEMPCSRSLVKWTRDQMAFSVCRFISIEHTALMLVREATFCHVWQLLQRLVTGQRCENRWTVSSQS